MSAPRGGNRGGRGGGGYDRGGRGGGGGGYDRGGRGGGGGGYDRGDRSGGGYDRGGRGGGGGGYDRGDRSGGGYDRGGRGGGGYDRGGRGGSGGGYDRGGRGGGGYDRSGRGGFGGRGGRGGGSSSAADSIDRELISSNNVNWEYDTSEIGKVLPEFVKRKEHLSERHGRVIQLMTNHFYFQLSNTTIYHYDFSWKYFGTEQEPKKAVDKKLTRVECYKLFDSVLDQHSNYFERSVGYDASKNVYVPNRLECENIDLRVSGVNLDGRNHRFVVVFKLANTIELAAITEYYAGHSKTFPREAIQALEVILKFPSRSTMVSLGRYSLFSVNGDRSLLSDWMQLAIGHRKSLRLSEIGMTLVVDRAATAFRKSGKATDFMRAMIQMREDLYDFRPNGYQFEALRRAFACIKVVTNHLGFTRNYTITRVSDKPANRATFQWKEDDIDEEVTVADYFERKWRKTLQYPNLPCLVTKSGAMIPMELCNIAPNQHPSSTMTRLSPDEQAEMIKQTATPPDSRFSFLLRAYGQVRQQVNEILSGFGMDIDIKPIGVRAIVLPAPKLVFAAAREVMPKDGKWDLRDQTFYKAKSFKKFGVINFCANPEEGMNFTREFIKKAAEMRMMELQGGKPEQPLILDLTAQLRAGQVNDPLLRLKLREMKEKGCAFALCFFPTDKAIYNLTKRVADCVVCFPSQGVALKNVRKPSPQLIANILAKINKKLGGVNFIIKQDQKPPLLKSKIMIIGADVTHPGEADELYSSVAASVSTYDKDHTLFYPAIRVQPKKNAEYSVTETIEDFRAMVQEHLKNFKDTNTFYPDVILYLRDGVSEGQYSQIITKEVNYLLQPFGTEIKYRPSVTAVIISKRIQTRTRPVDSSDGVGRHCNVPPGTTVDSIITHPADFDYFQYGHEGIQGTSKPCHYYIIHDDNKLSTPDMCKISFHLCHLFERCTRSTSAPAPVMHAHNLAYRARQWIIGDSRERPDLRGKTKEQRYEIEKTIAQQFNDKVKNIDVNFRKASMFFN